MKKTIIITLLIVGVMAVGVAAISGLTGRWTGQLLSPDGNTSEVEYNFKTDGTTLSGTLESVYGSSKIENGKVDGNQIVFNINLNGLYLPHKGKIYPDSVAMNVDYKGLPLHITLKRKAN
ncbi:MAG: hypothetical protein ACRYFB_06965 [Janthinobacterium lividum]